MPSIWTGALTFGLVNIPVSLASAVRGAERTRFRMLHEALVLELMRFANELVEPKELRFPDADAQKVRPQELAMAEQLIGNLAEPFDPPKYRDEYEEKLEALVKAKLKGKKLPDEGAADEPEQTKVIDLVARLQESLATTSARRRPTVKASGKTAVKRSNPRSGRRRRVS